MSELWDDDLPSAITQCYPSPFTSEHSCLDHSQAGSIITNHGWMES